MEPLLTIPVRSSNSRAPRLHQSHASVILDTPPISVHIQGDQARPCVVGVHKVLFYTRPLDGRFGQEMISVWRSAVPGAQYIWSMAPEQISD